MASHKGINLNVCLAHNRDQGHHIRAVQDIKKGELVFSDHQPILHAKDTWALTAHVFDTASQVLVQKFLCKFDDCHNAKTQWDAADEKELAKLVGTTGQKPEAIKDMYGTMCTYPIRSDDGIGLYPHVSFVNHSCDPNCTVVNFGKSIGIKAKRDIKKGEEITYAYFGFVTAGGPVGHKDLFRQIRRAVLKREFGFDCTCQACL